MNHDPEYQEALDALFCAPPISDRELESGLNGPDRPTTACSRTPRIVETAVRARRSWRRRQFAVAAAVALGALGIAAGTYRWAGSFSSTTLNFQNAETVLFDPSYAFERQRAAQVRIYEHVRDAIEAIQAVRSEQGIRELLTQVKAIADRPRSALEALVPHGEPLERMTARVGAPPSAGPPWSPEDSVRMLALLRAGIGALERSKTMDPEHREYAEIMLLRIQRLLADD